MPEYQHQVSGEVALLDQSKMLSLCVFYHLIKFFCESNFVFICTNVTNLEMSDTLLTSGQLNRPHVHKRICFEIILQFQRIQVSFIYILNIVCSTTRNGAYKIWRGTFGMDPTIRRQTSILSENNALKMSLLILKDF